MFLSLLQEVGSNESRWNRTRALFTSGDFVMNLIICFSISLSYLISASKGRKKCLFSLQRV